jgi:hypothetical protein
MCSGDGHWSSNRAPVLVGWHRVWSVRLAWRLSILFLGTSGVPLACQPSHSALDAESQALEREALATYEQSRRNFVAAENTEPRWPVDTLLSGHRVRPAQARLRIRIDQPSGASKFTEYRKFKDDWREVWTNWVKDEQIGCMVFVGLRIPLAPKPGVLRRFTDAAQRQTIERCIAEFSEQSFEPRETQTVEPEPGYEYRVHLEYIDSEGQWTIQRDNPGVHVVPRHLTEFMDCVCVLSASNGDYRDSPLVHDCSQIAEAERARSWWPDDDNPSSGD